MGLRFVFALDLVCVCFGSQAEPIMGLRLVFAFGLDGFGLGLMCVSQLLCLKSMLLSVVGVRSPVMAASRWTLPALPEGAGNGPMSCRVADLSCSQCV